MAFSDVLTRTAEGDALIYRAVIAYFRRFAYYDAAAVVNEKTFADSSTRVYFYTRCKLCRLAYRTCGKRMLFVYFTSSNA